MTRDAGPVTDHGSRVTRRLRTLTFEAGALLDPQSGADTTTGTPALERATPLKERSSLRVTN